MPTNFTEGRHAAEFVIFEGAMSYSRDNLVIGASQDFQAGRVLARLAVAAGVELAQAFAGTGDGVLTFADPAVNAKVKDGVYKAVCIAAATDGGRFRVEDPDGRHIGDAVVGAAFNKEIKFTIADGATDFAVGDEFSITVTANADDFQYVAHDPDASDGSEVAAAIALYPAKTGVGETAKIAGIVRHSRVNANLIIWKTGATAAQIADGKQALAEADIIVT